ncbi:MAG: hypothetical protein ACOC3G_02995 [Phycisphaeraceae bacterium]
MAKRSTTRKKQVDKLASMVESLRDERQALASRLEEIDDTFAQLGIAVEGGVAPAPSAAPARTKKAGKKKKPGRPRKKTTATTTKKSTGRRPRGTFPRTGEESVLAFVKELGSATAGEVNKKWRAEGRGGSADNTLGRLVKRGDLDREDVPGQRGGIYKVAK